MRHITGIVFLATLVFGIPPGYSATPTLNLSGTWTMDASRSESAHQAVPIGEIVLVVKQTATGISIETRRTEAGQTEFQSEVLPYHLNGTETTIPLEGKGSVKTKAHWDGNKLITETERNINGSSITTKNIHTLSAGGKELKIEKTLMVQHGYQLEGSKSYGTGTDVFVKSAQ